MTQSLHVITLGVSDLPRATTFYEKMGYALSPRSVPQISFFTVHGMVLALYPWDGLAADATVPAPGDGFRGVAISMCVSNPDEVQPVLDRAASLGGRIVKTAQRAEWGGHSGYYADPDDHLWEVAWNPNWVVNDDGTIHLPHPEEDR